MGDVESVAGTEFVDVGIGQHVVRRGDQVVDGSIAVAQGGKRSESRHPDRMPLSDTGAATISLVDDDSVDWTTIETVLCDLDGVVWLAHRAIDGSVDAIARIRATGRRVLFVTNNSAAVERDHELALEAIGIPAVGDVVSSAMAAAMLVEPGERVLVAGGAGVVEALVARGVDVVVNDGRGDPAGFDAVVVGLHRDFDFDRLVVASAAVRAGARLIGTNSDSTYPDPDRSAARRGSDPRRGRRRLRSRARHRRQAERGDGRRHRGATVHRPVAGSRADVP